MASQRGVRNVRAAFADAKRQLDEAAGPVDPPYNQPRNGHQPGDWPGYPTAKLPPDCPIVPLGKDGNLTFLVDTLGQLRTVEVRDWSKKYLVDLFALTPNFLYFHWPRWSESKKGRPSIINGLETDDAVACLIGACARRGLFSPVDKVRGRGGWTDKHGRFIWHSGDALWTMEGARLTVAKPGEVDDIFYPRRPGILEPWQQPVGFEDSPAAQLLQDFKSWSWQRPALDPILLLGWIVSSYMGGALAWRPTAFATGGFGVGKSTLAAVVKAILDDALHSTADTTAAGIYQRINQDCLPVAVDELEADADNRKVMAVVRLARLAASGAMMFRGGQDHAGVEFRAMNSFFFASINPPPLASQDKSRMVMLNLRKFDAERVAGSKPPTVSDVTGRMLLRQIMEEWVNFPRLLEDWRTTLRGAGLTDRAQDTYGTVLAAAQLVVGDAAMEEAGLPVTDQVALGAMLKEQTATERAEQTDNWRLCLERLLGSAIEHWHGGTKPTVGGTLGDLRERNMGDNDARDRLFAAGLGLKVRGKVCDGFALAVPPSGQAIEKIFAGTPFGQGVWFGALQQAPKEIVRRFGDNRDVTKISGASLRCLYVDLDAYDKYCEEEG